MSQVIVYTTEPCSFCTRVKGILKSRGVEFNEVNLAKDPAGRMQLVRETGMMSFPQVVVDGKLLGGFKEVQGAAEDGRLEELVGSGMLAEHGDESVSECPPASVQRVSPGSSAA